MLISFQVTSENAIFFQTINPTCVAKDDVVKESKKETI